MGIVKYKKPRNGIIYCYESTSKWDPEKDRHVQRVLIWADGIKRLNPSFRPTDAEAALTNRMRKTAKDFCCRGTGQQKQQCRICGFHAVIRL